MKSVSLTIYGKPQPAGSKKAFKHPKTGKIIVTDDAKGSRPWKQEVADTALKALNMREPPFTTGPLAISVTFYLARPKGHYGSGKNAINVKASSPARPEVKPDATKLLRAVEDALTGVVWRDDAQIVEQHVYKVYGLPERCEIEVHALVKTYGENGS